MNYELEMNYTKKKCCLKKRKGTWHRTTSLINTIIIAAIFTVGSIIARITENIYFSLIKCESSFSLIDPLF